MKDINAVEIELKRNKLTRSYQLTSEYLSMQGGYLTGDYLPSKWQYVAKLLEYQFLSHYWGSPPSWRMLLRKFNTKRTLPDFCVIGAVKSGTSDLSTNLILHPNVIAPLAKEFYLLDIDKWRVFYPTVRQKQNHATCYGLALSPFLAPYIHEMELTYNLSQVQPNTKIVLVLRDPVKRVYSQWKWDVWMAGKENTSKVPFLTSFSAYVDKSLAVFPEYPRYTSSLNTLEKTQALQLSIYWVAVNHWIECFGRDNVLVLDVGEYFVDSNHFLNQIYEFVGLPSFECPTFNNRINENPVVLPKPDEESLLKLSGFFKPYNEKLWQLLGREFDWE